MSMDPAQAPLPSDIPVLDKPGAGVPTFERLFYKYYVGPYIAARSDWDKNWDTFDRINRKTIALADNLSDEKLTTRILVPRLRGIEDSSRYWSVAMTLEHLVIVGTGITSIVKSLGNNIVPPIKVNTASVKPKGAHAPRTDMNDFHQFAGSARMVIEGATRLPISRMHTLDHPWFGPFDALQWQWMLGVHGVIHYRQIKAIVAQL